MRAEALSRKEVGAVVFGRTGDPATGRFSDAKVIRKFGEVGRRRASYWPGTVNGTVAAPVCN
jgi:hypothetical protein